MLRFYSLKFQNRMRVHQFRGNALSHHNRRHVRRERRNIGQDRRFHDVQRFDNPPFAAGVDDSRRIGVRSPRHGRCEENAASRIGTQSHWEK